ncbi:MAG: ROK family protein [Opitutaceae bacterium]|nr:ROK family protein [Opitutaceae bacterium]
MKVLGIDIGGSALKGAPVDTQTGELLAERCRIETPSPSTPARVAKVAGEIARHFHWRGPVGIGFPGVVMEGRIMAAANLHPAWKGVDGVKLFRQATGCRVSALNDADAAGLAEMRFGAGKKCRGTVLMFTLGTGIGTALFHRGMLFPRTELGHLPWKGREAEELVAAAVRKKKGLSWHRWGRRVDEYLQKMESLFWPDLIIIGGGVSARHENWFRYLHLRTPVVPAKLRNDAGIVGAALAAEMVD